MTQEFQSLAIYYMEGDITIQKGKAFQFRNGSWVQLTNKEPVCTIEGIRHEWSEKYNSYIPVHGPSGVCLPVNPPPHQRVGGLQYSGPTEVYEFRFQYTGLDPSDVTKYIMPAADFILDKVWDGLKAAGYYNVEPRSFLNDEGKSEFVMEVAYFPQLGLSLISDITSLLGVIAGIIMVAIGLAVALGLIVATGPIAAILIVGGIFVIIGAYAVQVITNSVAAQTVTAVSDCIARGTATFKAAYGRDPTPDEYNAMVTNCQKAITAAATVEGPEKYIPWVFAGVVILGGIWAYNEFIKKR